MRKIDASRVAQLAARPGIDPRVWLTFGVVKDIVFDAADNEILCDLQLDDGNFETARIGSPFCIDGGGLFLPIAVGDRVLVAVPNGDPGSGPIVLQSVWSSRLKPSQLFAGQNDEITKDVVLHLKDSKIRLVTDNAEIQITSSGNDILLTAKGKVTIQAAEVLIGDASEPATKATTLAQWCDLVKNHTHTVIVPTMGGPVPTPTGIPGDAAGAPLVSPPLITPNLASSKVKI